jgi:hypothetical protein
MEVSMFVKIAFLLLAEQPIPADAAKWDVDQGFRRAEVELLKRIGTGNGNENLQRRLDRIRQRYLEWLN